jgi:ectoine hydroxylase-related dioxygenase (phytanoyl-CoA dioxygenase family)
LKRNRAFDAIIDNSAVLDALDAVFAPAGWQPPKPGAQILLTLPRAGPWKMHDGWHMDCGFQRPTWPTHTVKLFAFFGEVGPCGGGTMLLAGSHRLVDLYRSGFEVPPAGGNANWRPFLRRHPPLGDLLQGATLPDLGRSMVGERYDIEGIPVEVIELTGRPGDIVLTHLHVFHCASPNTSDKPRQMLGKAIAAA